MALPDDLVFVIIFSIRTLYGRGGRIKFAGGLFDCELEVLVPFLRV